MSKNKELESFLERNNISPNDWENCQTDWDVLKAIGLDHSERLEQRKETAELFARVIQRCPKVHSVRWRVKEPEHLMEKIVRKTTKGTETYNEEYLGISESNYHEIVTDLVGIRALHLFKDDCFEIDEYLRGVWHSKEDPVYYVRVGDESKIEGELFSVKTHPAGYRSLHYVFESQPMNQKVYTEVQVRTIFEEGWSEIDHKVRYPNFSDNEQVSYFLKIFNRLAGSADEMGSFVKDLVSELEASASELKAIKAENAKIKEENEKNISEIDRLFLELDSSEGQNRTQSELVKNLKAEVEKLKEQSKKTTSISNSHKSISGRGHSHTFKSLFDSIQRELEVAEQKDVKKPRKVAPTKTKN
ncbi:hypothetical protein ACCH70_004423 [Vibrio vulnificus]|nr:hypothetical protein [Vibrio vulnificus]